MGVGVWMEGGRRTVVVALVVWSRTLVGGGAAGEVGEAGARAGAGAGAGVPATGGAGATGASVALDSRGVELSMRATTVGGARGPAEGSSCEAVRDERLAGGTHSQAFPTSSMRHFSHSHNR